MLTRSMSAATYAATLNARFWRLEGSEARCTAGRPWEVGGPSRGKATRQRLPRHLTKNPAVAPPCRLATGREDQMTTPRGVRTSPQPPCRVTTFVWQSEYLVGLNIVRSLA
ncbi:hypothetical protein ACJJTC_014819 [Scirpophaga incertulas]